MAGSAPAESNECMHEWGFTPGGGLVQWSKLPAWKVGDRGFEPCSGIQISNKQNVSSPLTRKDLISWEASVTER